MEAPLNKLLRFRNVSSNTGPRLAAEVSVANVEVIDVAEKLARQALEVTDPVLRQTLLDAASRLVDVNRKVNTAVENAIASPSN